MTSRRAIDAIRSSLGESRRRQAPDLKEMAFRMRGTGGRNTQVIENPCDLDFIHSPKRKHTGGHRTVYYTPDQAQKILKRRRYLRHLAFAACFFLGLSGSHAGAADGVVRAPEATSSALSAIFNCMEWKVVGLCFWLKCGWKGCKVKVSLKIRNYAPAAYTTSFVSTSTTSLAGLSFIDSSGSIEARRREGEARDHQTFRDADLYGHPLNAGAFMAASGLGLVCPARTVPMFPYFESYLDALTWRDMVPVESLYPASSIPGLREIGHFPTNTWGNVFPRSGRVVQQEEPKAGAVIAQRVGDIVTRSFQPHVYVPLESVKSSSFGMKYWDPGPLVENDPSTGKWQMFHPTVDNSCYAFGENDATGITSWSDGRRSTDGEYAFNLWRPYTCCRERGWFLFDINF